MKTLHSSLLFLLSLAILGCVQSNPGYSSQYTTCEGYSASVQLAGSTSLDSLASTLPSQGFSILYSNLSKKEFEAAPINCPGADIVKRKLNEYTYFCDFAENSTTYRKEYRHAKFQKEGSPYKFTLYEQCNGNLKAYVDYSGPCTNETKVRQEIAGTLSGFSLTPSKNYALIKKTE